MGSKLSTSTQQGSEVVDSVVASFAAEEEAAKTTRKIKTYIFGSVGSSGLNADFLP
jgi:hypothetical protein